MFVLISLLPKYSVNSLIKLTYLRIRQLQPIATNFTNITKVRQLQHLPLVSFILRGRGKLCGNLQVTSNNIESVNDELKNNARVEHSRHRCFDNFLINLLGALAAYCFFPKWVHVGVVEYYGIFNIRDIGENIWMGVLVICILLIVCFFCQREKDIIDTDIFKFML